MANGKVKRKRSAFIIHTFAVIHESVFFADIFTHTKYSIARKQNIFVFLCNHNICIKIM